MTTLDEVLKAYATGKKLKFLLFWGHRPSPSGEVTSSCFSQWWHSDFTVDEQKYPTTEHWMMAEKARLFKDESSLSRIIQAPSPGEAKKIGREVAGFDQEVWDLHRSRIVEKGNYHKFSQNVDLKDYLLNTKNRILVEASPVDAIWGIGLPADHQFAKVPPKWRGLNLLGFALMAVRQRLTEESS